MSARVLEVDNAREKVTPDGSIIALDAIRKKPGKVELILLAAAYAHPAVLAFMEGSKIALHEVEKTSVHYPIGTDLALQIQSLPQLPLGDAPTKSAAPAAPAELSEALHSLANRSETYHTQRPADWVNIAFAADKDDLAAAFEAAGWKAADHLSVQSDLKVFLALAHQHSYERAPVSRLSVAGALPEFVYQKQTNTFAKRHHIRIWASDRIWRGRPLWIAAATHDIGIDFSARAKTFTHRIDSDIDQEREKVASDLSFAGAVQFDHFIDRPEVPAESENATGDRVHTDGRLRVLVLSRN